jgi:hypothetical protein
MRAYFFAGATQRLQSGVEAQDDATAAGAQRASMLFMVRMGLARDTLIVKPTRPQGISFTSRASDGRSSPYRCGKAAPSRDVQAREDRGPREGGHAPPSPSPSPAGTQREAVTSVESISTAVHW